MLAWGRNAARCTRKRTGSAPAGTISIFFIYHSVRQQAQTRRHDPTGKRSMALLYGRLHGRLRLPHDNKKVTIMPSIKDFRMGESLLNNDNIEIKKSFLGLQRSACYKPTGSRLRAFCAEYTPEEGAKLERILSLPVAEWETQLGNKRPQTTPMGNMILEGCASEDGRFAVLHLLRYQDFRLVEVVKPMTFEDQEATIVSRLF